MAKEGRAAKKLPALVINEKSKWSAFTDATSGRRLFYHADSGEQTLVTPTDVVSDTDASPGTDSAPQFEENYSVLKEQAAEAKKAAVNVPKRHLGGCWPVPGGGVSAHHVQCIGAPVATDSVAVSVQVQFEVAPACGKVLLCALEKGEGGVFRVAAMAEGVVNVALVCAP